MIEKDKAISSKLRFQQETDKLRTELYGGKNDSIKLVAEMRELSESLFNQEESKLGLEKQLDKLKSEYAEISMKLLEANKKIKEKSKPAEVLLVRTSDVGLQCSL